MFKMADNRAKRERKIPKRFIEEFVEAKPKNYKKTKTMDRNISSGDNTGRQREEHG